jgi:hypothetical protein
LGPALAAGAAIAFAVGIASGCVLARSLWDVPLPRLRELVPESVMLAAVTLRPAGLTVGAAVIIAWGIAQVA